MRKTWFGSAVFAIVALALVYGQSTPSASEETQRTYVGVAKCKTCHKTEAQGAQFTIWEKTAHAKAFQALAGDPAKAIAKEKGIADPQKAEACVKCHVTAFGVDAKYLGESFSAADGVQCEACHGAGGDYYKMTTMKDLTSGKIQPASVGLMLPDAKTCTKCHNEESPTFKGFDYEKMVAKITHKIPAERRALYKKP